MQGRVRVRAAQGLHQGREDVEVLVPLPVIAHGAALGDGFGVGEGDDPVFGGGEEKLHGVDGFSHIAPAGRGNVVEHAFLGREGHVAPRVHDVHRALDCGLYILGRDGLELEDGRTAEDGVEDGEVGVFGGGGDERDASVLDKLQKGLLLLFIEILDLVEVQKHAARCEEGVQLVDDLLDVGDARGGGVELSEGAVGALRDDAGYCCFARARGAVEDHVRDLPALHDAAQKPALAEDVPLAHHIVKRFRADLVRKRLIHGAPSLS